MKGPNTKFSPLKLMSLVIIRTRPTGCTPVCSKIFESNETMANENKHNDIEQNRQVVEPIRNVGERNICRISNMKKSI